VLDDRNAIAVRAGYQYQNVLTPGISQQLVTQVSAPAAAGAAEAGAGAGAAAAAAAARIVAVFSGDDHDYCEVVHRQYTTVKSGGDGDEQQQRQHTDGASANGGKGSSGSSSSKTTTTAAARIREITVKSLSWAMGVRRPGFVMVSLWNPVDEWGHSLLAQQQPQSQPESQSQPQSQQQSQPQPRRQRPRRQREPKTLQTHLCLLPDQLGVFVRYGYMAAVSGVVLLLLALLL
jgi:hypothetical protein